jgi:acyl-CoA thioesterase
MPTDDSWCSGEVADQRARKIGIEMLENDQGSQQLGLKITKHNARQCQVEMSITSNMTNGHDICHGGYIFSLADSALAFACNGVGVVAVTSAAQIDFMNAANLGDVLSAEATVKFRQGRQLICDVKICNQESQLIALCRGRQVSINNRSHTQNNVGSKI